MQRLNDKYGRGSAAVNGAGFVDLEPGDTFSGLEAKLRLLQTVIYENRMLGLRASIASRRNANELSKHMAPGEKEEAHKFAAKNVGALFARGVVGVRHFDKKAIRDDAPKPVVLRIFSVFVFAKERMIATITLRQEKDGNKLYAIEALEINKDTDSERTPRGGTAPLQNQVSQLASRIAYYVGDVNRTKPVFLARSEPFSIECATKLIRNEIMNQTAATRMKISLITVCYNAEKTIADAMESVLTQRHRDTEIEYIVVDGGSTDSTVDIIKKFAEQFHCTPTPLAFTFRWLSEKDNGMYDALNKGMKMATGDVIGLLNADDVLAEDDTLAKIAAAFVDPTIDGTYGDIRFVKELGGPTVRYCSGKRFRPWMFRFGTQTAHPSTFFRKECFAKWGDYSLDYGMYGDFELLCRFIWKNRARMKYLPICTTVMRMGGASTNGWRTTLKINRSDLRALKANGCWSCLPLLYSRYLLKIWGFIFRG